MSEPVTTFNTSHLSDLDINLINVLITQAIQNPESKAAVIRACKFVLERLEADE